MHNGSQAQICQITRHQTTLPSTDQQHVKSLKRTVRLQKAEKNWFAPQQAINYMEFAFPPKTNGFVPRSC